MGIRCDDARPDLGPSAYRISLVYIWLVCGATEGRCRVVVDFIAQRDEMKSRRHEFTLWPRMWQEFNMDVSLEWHTRRLTRSERSNIPTSSGIYTFLVQPGIANHPQCSYLVYVGQAVSLRNRFNNYLGREKRITGRPKVVTWLNMYEDYMWFCYSLVPRAKLDDVEAALLTAYIPIANDQFPTNIRRIVRAF